MNVRLIYRHIAAVTSIVESYENKTVKRRMSWTASLSWKKCEECHSLSVSNCQNQSIRRLLFGTRWLHELSLTSDHVEITNAPRVTSVLPNRSDSRVAHHYVTGNRIVQTTIENCWSPTSLAVRSCPWRYPLNHSHSERKKEHGKLPRGGCPTSSGRLVTPLPPHSFPPPKLDLISSHQSLPVLMCALSKSCDH